MSDARNPAFSPDELEASLRALGAAELEQRLEFAPLLTGSVDGGMTQDDDNYCCTCKVPPKSDSDIPNLATLPSDPTPGDQFWGTGPTDGSIR